MVTACLKVGAFLTSFFLAFLVLSFVLTVGLMVQIVGYMLQGIPVDLVARFAFVSFPETMQWTIPIALLVSSILVFSRMSADSEVAAMRACGVNLLTVTRWPLLFAVVCTVLGVFVNNEIVPRGHQVRRDLTRRISVSAGLEPLEPGRVIGDVPKVKIDFEEKEGNWLKDLIVLDFSNPKVDRMVTAAKALVTSEGRDVVLDLHGMTVDPLDERNPGMARAARFQYRVKDALKDRTYKRKVKDFRFLEMMDKIREAKSDVKNPEVAAARKAKERLEKDDGRDRTEKKDSVAKELKLGKKVFKRQLSELRTEFQKRMVFALASICFVLVGIPLGIRAQRRESSIGMAIALVVALGYYLVVILMTSMDKSYAVRPDLLIWLPVVLCAALAGYLIPKNL